MSNFRKINFEIDKNGCYNCISHKPNGMGYCQVVVNGKICLIHRLVYMVFLGDIPNGLVVRHKCDNRRCINPEHLELGTQGDNIRDIFKRGRGNQPTGERHSAAKLKEKQVKEILKRSTNGESLGNLAKDFKVGRTAVFNIIHGKTWRYLKNENVR